MEKLKWRVCSALLVLCMVLPLVPANVWAADGNIPVKSKSLEVPLFNKQTYLNNAFKEETLYGVQNTKQMNAGGGFERFSTKGCENDPAQFFDDNFGVLLEHDWDYGWWVAHYQWDTNTAPVFRELMQQGELSAEISAIMCYDEHRFLFRHGTAKDHAYFGLRHSSQVNTSAYIKYIQTSDSAGDEVMKRYGNNSWVALPYKANDSVLYLRLNHTYCECGSSKITNGTVAFADTAGPGVPKVSMTTSGGNGRYFSSGTIDITLTFDEYIRLANPNVALSQNDALKYGLNLLAYDRKTNVSTTLTARLAEIGEKTMRFQYTIPDEDLDVVITGISSNQPFFSNAELYMYTSNGKYESFPGFNLQTSLVCDLAGNRLNDQWNTNIYFPENQQYYIDTIAPQYVSSALQGNMISSGTTPGDPEAGTWPEGADRSQVFAGVGDWLQMQIYFNEELLLQNPAQVEVVLNIKDANGNPITVNGSTVTSLRTGVDARIPVTMLTTERFTIQEGWMPAEPGRAIRAVEIRMPSSATDLCGNAFSNSTISVNDIPAQQEYLDVTAPTFETIWAPNNEGVYTLRTYQDGAAYFAVKVTDKADDRITGESQAHISGSDAVGDNPNSTESGSFTLDGTNVSGDSITFEYYVTALSNPTISEDSWKTGYAGTAIRFTQVQDGTYIFIRPVPGQEYIQLHDPVLTVQGFDYAGNKAETAYRLSQPDLFRDNTPPTGGANVVMAAENGRIGFTANMEARDIGGFKQIAYKLECLEAVDGNEPTYEAPMAPGNEGEGWKYIDVSSVGSEHSFKAEPVWVDGKDLYYAYLTLYVQDTDGNEFIQTYKGSADWRLGAFSISVPAGLSAAPISISRLDKTFAKDLKAKTRGIRYIDDTDSNMDTSWTEETYGSLYVYIEPQRELSVKETLRPMALVIDDLVDDGTGNPVSRQGVVGGAENDRIDDLFKSLDTIDTSPWVSTLEGPTLPEENQFFFRGMLANFSQKWDPYSAYDNDVLNEDRTELSINTRDNYYHMEISEYHANYPEWVQELADAYQNYYGELKLYTINAPVATFEGHKSFVDGTDDYSFKYSIRPDLYYPWDVQEYTVKRAYVAKGDTNPVHAVEVSAPFLNDGTDMVLGDDGKYYKADRTTLHTLSGVRIPFEISNVRAAEWGMDDLDFEKSYMQLYVNDKATGEPVPLAANSAGQVFSFPDDLIYDCTSTYDVKVTLTAKTSGHTDEYSIMQPIMFCTTTADPYFQSLSLQNAPGYIEIEVYEDGDIDALVLHEEMIGNNPGEYNIGIDVEGKKNMSGNSEVCPENWEEGGHRSYGEIRVWNAAVPEKQWVVKASRYSLFFTLVDSAEEILELPSDSNFDMIAPLIREQQNIICIQGSSDYDYKVGGTTYYVNEPGEVIQIPVTLTSGQIPEVSLQARPADRTAQSAELTANISSTYDIKELWYQKGSLEEDGNGYIHFYDMVQVTLDEENRLCMADTGERITLSENDDYTLLAIDSYGGVAVAETTVNNIDSIAPEMSVNESMAADGSYSLDLTVTEENPDADPSNLTLYLSAKNPDEETAAEPEQPDDENPTVPVTEPFTIIPWSEAPNMTYGGAASETGIYAMEAEYSGDETGHTLHAVIEGAVPETGTIWAWTTDEAGNRSEPEQLFSNAKFVAPSFESVEKDPNGGVILYFTSGVMLTQPTSGMPDDTYGKVKSGVPIYQDGTHTITYYDFFGNSYSEPIKVALDGDFSMANVSFSETAPTTNDVTVTVTSSDENHLLKMGDCTVTDLAGTPMDTGLYTVMPGEDEESVQILMKENGIINVGMIYGEQTATKAIRVDNIDREVNAMLLWSYADGMDHEPGEEVDGAVTVRAVSTDSSETLIGTNGALSYIFAEGSSVGASYTFEYRDPAGNTGSITAELPVNIKSNIPEPLSFTMEVFLTQRGVLTQAGSYKYSEGDDYSFENMPASMENRLNIQANRPDAEVLILPEGTSSADINETTQSADIVGITLSGKSVIITKNVPFTLAVRSGGEALALPVSVTNISQLGEVDLIYATLDRYSRRVYFDPNGQSLTLTNQTGIALETEHTQYQGYYYHDFTANGSFTFYYEDAAGNTGSITASVWDLVAGNVEPEDPALPIRWWPYKILDAEGTSQNQLTDSAVNYDVTAQIKYNMNITEATLLYNDGSGIPGNPVPLDVASLNVSLDTVNITYHQNADTILLVTGENGTRHTLPIGAVSIIDKTTPEVTHDYVARDDKRQSAEITFTPGEEVLCDNIPSAQYYSPDNPMKVTVTANGTYNYTFRDKAGNQTTLTVEVTDIDTTAPQLQFKLSTDGTEYDSWEALSADNDVTNVESIYLCANELAVCQFQGQEIILNEGMWEILPITRNGVYGMTVTDSAGNAALLSLSGILMPDETAPTLWVTPSRISVYIGISEEALSDALMTGVIASDNNSAAEEIKITVNRSRLDVTKKGVYEVSYTAEDRAGNIGTATRSVTVIGADDLTLTVNGVLTTPMGTMVLNTGLVDFAVGNLPEINGIFEPYLIYVKKGFLTMGQMKNNANKVQGNHAELYGSGYYTVYVVAQNRRQYLTYLYIEQ